MKKSFLLFTAAAGIGYLSLTSSATGPHATYTTGDLTATGCSGTNCHGANDNLTSLNLTLIEVATSAPVTNGMYKPGTAYRVSLSGSNSAVVGSPTARAGFQMKATHTTGGNTAGSFAVPASMHKHNVGGVEFVEHASPTDFVASIFTISDPGFTWTAPAAGAGNITFNIAVNAVNGNGSNDTADHASLATVTFAEDPLSLPALASHIRIQAYPSPAGNQVNLKFEGAEAGVYQLTVLDAAGRRVAAETRTLNTAAGTLTLESGSWNSGLHFVQILKDGAQRTLPIVKQ